MQTLTSLLLKSILSAVVILFISSQAMADIAVIVNPSSNISSLTKSEIKALYLGKSKKLKPIDQVRDSEIRKEFMDKVVGKSESQFKAYWSSRIFSGKGKPPRIFDSNSAVKSQVAGSANAIGFIDSSEIDDSVRVVYKIQ